jgi:hypothetical protein
MTIEKPEPAEGVTLDVPDEIYSQLEAVRRLGAVNMANAVGVQDVAEQCGFEELAEWLDDRRNRRQEYPKLLTEGPRRKVELEIGGEAQLGREPMPYHKEEPNHEQ